MRRASLLLPSRAVVSQTFAMRMNSAGTEVLWAVTGGGACDHGDRANGIASDGNGGAYVTGSFHCDTAVFGSTTLTNAGDYYGSKKEDVRG